MAICENIRESSGRLKNLEKNGYLYPKYFVDDGISGTTFDRPGFREMEALIEAGKVSAVIVKDYCAIIGRNQKDLENQGILA